MLFLCALIAGAGLRAQTSTVGVGAAPFSVVVNPATNKIYVANYNGNNVTVINGLTNATSTVTTGNAPNAFAVNVVTNKIYVANFNGNSLTVIDGSNDTVKTTIGLGNQASSVVVNPVTNKIYVSSRITSNVAVIDGSTDTLKTTFAVGTTPYALAMNPVTNRIYVANYGANTVSVINGATDAVIATVNVGSGPASIAVSPITNKIYVANSTGASISVIDGATYAVTSVALGSNPRDVALNVLTDRIYTCNDTGTASVIDGSNNSVITTVTAGPSYASPWGLAVDVGTNRIYVVNNGASNVAVIDGATNAVTNTVTVGNQPYAVAVNPVTNRLYVTNFSSNTVTVIDGAKNATSAVTAASRFAVAVNPATNKIYVGSGSGAVNTLTVIDGATNGASSVTTGTQPQAVAVNPVTNKIYTANSASNTVTVVDAANSNATSTVTVGTSPNAVAVNPVTNRIYVANAGSNNVTVIDGATNATTTVTTGSNTAGFTLSAIVVNPVTNKIYVSNQTGNSVTVIDGATNATSTVAVGTSPRNMAVNTVTNKIYVGNTGSSNVTVIDGATNSTSTVTVGSAPTGLALNSVTNKIYVTNNSSSTVTVIDAANSNATSTVSTIANPYGVVVNPLTNRIYVGSNNVSNVTVIAGEGNVTSTVATGANPYSLGVNPITNKIYTANFSGGNVTVIDVDVEQTIPLTTTISGVTDSQTLSSPNVFTTTNATPTFNVSVTSNYSGAAAQPPPTQVYWEVDGASPSNLATVTSSAGANPASFTIMPATQKPGLHALYAYAAYGHEGGYNSNVAANQADSTGNAPRLGNLTAFLFAVVPIPTTTSVTADVNPQNSGSNVTFTATVTPTQSGGVGPTGTVSFYDGTTLLGTGTLGLVSGSYIATFQTSALSIGTHTITATYSGDGNYAGSSGTMTQTIVGPAAAIVAVSGGGQTTTYGTAFASPLVAKVTDSLGNAVPGATVTFSGAGLSFTPATASTNSSGQVSVTVSYTNAGSYTASASVSGVSTPATFSLTVNKAVLTVTASNASRVYGAANPTFTYTITGFVSGETQSVVSGSPSLTTTATTSSPVGTYTISAALGTLAATNYSFTFVNGTLTVTTAALTIKANDASRIYGAANPTFTGTVTGAVNDDTFTLSFSTTASAASPVGTYPIVPSVTGANLANYTVTATNGTLTITPATLTIKANDVSRTYGAANPTFSGTIVGAVNGDTFTESFSTTATSASPAGTYAIVPSVTGANLANYTVTAINGTLTVNRAVLTVTADSATRFYGAANPAFTSSITGFVNGDTQSVVSGAPSLTTTATATSPPGNYAIQAGQGTLSATNYTFTFVNGTLTVTQLASSATTLSVAPSSVMYGDAAALTASVTPTFATGTVSFFEGTTLLGTASVGDTGTAVLPVSTLSAGTHSLTAQYNGDQGVPASSSSAVQLTVTKRTASDGGPAITVTVNDATRTTSESNPPFTYSAGGQLVNGDTFATAIQGTPVYSTTAGSVPGVYDVTVTGLTSANYTITFVDGHLSVVATSTSVTLVAAPTSTQYGDQVTLTANVTTGATGAVSFFDGAVLLGTGTLSSGGVATLTTTTLSAGSHDITAVYNGDIGFASSTSAPATVTVAKKSPGLTVTVQDASRQYGTANPQFAYVVTGTLVNGDAYAAAVTGVPVYSVADTPVSPAGSSFPINVSGLTSQNYTLAFVPGTLTIVSASTTTTLATSAASTQYGDSVTLTATVAPSEATGTVEFSEGTTVLGQGTVSGGVATFTTTALNAKTYTITASYTGDSNYGASTSGAVTITVAKKTAADGGAALTVTVDNASRLTGEGNPAFSYTVTGTLVNGDTYSTAVIGVPVFSTTANETSPTGTYPVSIESGLSSMNYVIAFVSGTLTVNTSPSTVALASSPNPSTYGSAVTFTATVPSDATGAVTFIEQSPLQFTLGTATISSGVAAFTTSALTADTYQVQAHYDGDSKYGPANSALLTQTVNKAVLTVQANDATRAFGAVNPTFTTTITGFVNGDTAAAVSGSASLTTTATASSAVGTYTIAAAQGTLSAANYTFTFVNGTLTVIATASSSTTLSVNPATVMYGDPAVLTAIVAPSGSTGTVSFFEGSTLLGTAALDGTTTAVLPVSTLPAGTHSISAHYNGDANAPPSTSSAVPLTVTQRTAAGGGPALTVTVNNATRTTTEANPPFTYSASGQLVNGDTFATAIQGTPVYSTTAGSVPGTYDITVTGLTSANYTIEFVQGTLTVVISPTTTTLTSSPATTQYGDPVTLTATVPNGATGTVSFFDGAVLLGAGTVSGGVATFVTMLLPAGTYTITAAYNGDGIYATSESGPVTGTVAKKTSPDGSAALTVTVQDASKEFGTANPQFSYVVTGTLINGDTYVTAVTGTPVYAVGAALTSSTFPITVSGLGSQNYTLALVPGTLTVVSASTTTTLTTSAPSTQYGDPITFTATVAPSGATGSVQFSNGSTVLGTGTISGGVATLTTSSLNAGSYTITATYPGDGNYASSTSAPVAVTVAQKTAQSGGAALTITVDNTSRYTGQGNPAFTYTVSGDQNLVNGDTDATAITGVPVFSTLATPTSPAGTYPVSVSGLNSTNYTLAFVSGTLTVIQSTTTVALTSSPNPSTYGNAVTFTATTAAADATGTVTFTDETTSSTLGIATISGGVSTPTTSALAVGTHAIVATYGGDSKYSAATSSVLNQVVNKAVLTVTATSITRSYGTANPAFASNIFGFVNGDTMSAVSGTPSLTTTATDLSPVGTYPIIALVGTLSATNYTFILVNGTLTVTGLSSSTTTLTLTPSTVMYGDPDLMTATVVPTFATGTVSFDEGATYLGSATLDSTGIAALRVSTLNVGTHNLTAKYNGDQGVPASSPSDIAQLTVTQRTGPGGTPALVILVSDATRTANAPNPPFSYSVSGTLVNGDTYSTAISGTPAFSTTAGSTPGSYSITLTGLTSANYTITVLNGTLTVTPDGIGVATTTTLAANTTSSNYGDPIILTATVDPGSATGAVSFFDGITLLGNGSLSSGVATLTTTALSAGSHSITALYSGDGTHSSSLSASATVTVAKRTLTVTVENASVAVAQAAPQFIYGVTGTLYNGDTYATAVTGTPVYSGFSPGGTAGQTYEVAVSGLSSQNYALTFVAGTVTIVSVASTTTLTTSTILLSHDNPLTLTASVTSSGASGSVVFTEGTTVLGTATLSGGTATLTTTSLAAGRHSIAATYLGDTNYGSSTSSVVTVTVTLSPQPLIVTVNNASRLTGQGNPAFTYTVTGPLATGDTYATAVTGVPIFSTTATVASPAATYPISIVGGLNSINYSLTFVNGVLTIGQSTTTITLTSSLNPSTYGAQVTFTATVAADATGTITFIDQATGDTLGTGIISGGKATLTTSTLVTGSYQVVANYGGDSKYAEVASSVLTQTVNKAVLTVTADNFTRPYNSPNPTLTATITGFVNGETAAVVTGTPSLTTTATIASPVGTYPIVAAQGTLAAANYNFTFVNGTLTIAAGASTTTTLSANPASTQFGTPITFTATVAPNGATGAVKFSNGAIVLGTGTLSSGVATLTTSSLNAGTYTISATYPGDANYSASTSGPVTVTIVKATPGQGGTQAVTVASSLNPSVFGNSVTFTATVPATATGTVTFYAGTISLGTAAITAGKATLTTSALAAGTPSITAQYGGDANFNSAASTALAQVVNQAATSVALAVMPNPVVAGNAVTMTATVTAGATGTVTFFDSATALGTAPIGGTTATLLIGTLSPLAPGSYNITAHYNGDANHTPAISFAVSLIVTPASTADFALANKTPPQIIPPGAAASFTIAVTSVNAAFTNAVTLTVSGLPPGASYTFTPASVTPGATGASSTLIISVPKQSVALRRHSQAPLVLALLLVPFAALRRQRGGPARLALWLLLALSSFGAVTGCGGGGYYNQPQRTYVITVTGASGDLVRNTTATLTVE
ncbi:MAG TPA: Ig-like domain repeat protein [Edaphobacter sp.]|nr:Ig-like domain repeat protein [Edaphobacter sp.]